MGRSQLKYNRRGRGRVKGKYPATRWSSPSNVDFHHAGGGAPVQGFEHLKQQDNAEFGDDLRTHTSSTEPWLTHEYILPDIVDGEKVEETSCLSLDLRALAEGLWHLPVDIRLGVDSTLAEGIPHQSDHSARLEEDAREQVEKIEKSSLRNVALDGGLKQRLILNPSTSCDFPAHSPEHADLPLDVLLGLSLSTAHVKDEIPLTSKPSAQPDDVLYKGLQASGNEKQKMYKADGYDCVAKIAARKEDEESVLDALLQQGHEEIQPSSARLSPFKLDGGGY